MPDLFSKHLHTEISNLIFHYILKKKALGESPRTLFIRRKYNSYKEEALIFNVLDFVLRQRCDLFLIMN